MNLKQNILKILLNAENEYISGENLAKQLNISRNSVWKAIKSLKTDGYTINAVTNKGYLLLSTNDILSAHGIQKYLKNRDFFDIDVHSSVTSTNNLLKDLANNGEKEGKTIVSSHQSAGRGRLERNFYSPEDTGVYFSFLLRPKIEASQSIFLTSMSSIAVNEAIFTITEQNSQIKWVNDIFFNDKKVCGILCEVSFTMENFSLDYVILGIGINVYKPQNDFPDEISEIAGFLLENPIDDVRNRLVANILDNFLRLYNEFDTKKLAQLYKSQSYVLGKDIFVIKGHEQKKARVLDIDDNCGLVVKYENNQLETLISGEISTKIIK